MRQPIAPRQAVNEAPIFIGGCDRSGTTMLGSLVGEHPACIVTPESPFKTDILARLPVAASSSSYGASTLELIRKSWRYKIWGHQLGEMEPPATFSAVLQAVVSSYAVANGRSPAARWVDHTPNNVRHATSLLREFPEARFVHVVRDGRAVANSVMPLDWGPNTILYAASWWMERLAYGLAAESSLGSRRVLRVRYEDLLREPLLELKRVQEFLHLPEAPENINNPSYRSPSYTASQHGLIGKPPDRSRLDRFRATMATRDIELFEWATRDMLTYLGYELDFNGRTRGPTLSEKARATFVEFGRGRLNRIRNNRRRTAAVREVEI